MSDGIGFRPITPDDGAFLLEVYASTRSDEMALLDWSGREKQAFLEQQFNAQHTYYQEQFDGARFDVIERDGRPIGRLYVDRCDDVLHVIDIALLPAHRRRGIGGAIMSDLLAEAGAAGKPVRIHVERHNPAMRLYERLGFRPIGDTGVYLLMEWTP
ncbi:MAG: GNAT family N-acetyltransferase [Phycisphaeraceae bacterium]|nr:GNAT family N-acetyltransferase [Phycisphaeraceae bacterium]